MLQLPQWPWVNEVDSPVMLDIGMCFDLVTSTVFGRVKRWSSTGPTCNKSDISRVLSHTVSPSLKTCRQTLSGDHAHLKEPKKRLQHEIPFQPNELMGGVGCLSDSRTVPP